jgi:hypothetical protein
MSQLMKLLHNPKLHKSEKEKEQYQKEMDNKYVVRTLNINDK